MGYTIDGLVPRVSYYFMVGTLSKFIYCCPCGSGIVVGVRSIMLGKYYNDISSRKEVISSIIHIYKESHERILTLTPPRLGVIAHSAPIFFFFVTKKNLFVTSFYLFIASCNYFHLGTGTWWYVINSKS